MGLRHEIMVVLNRLLLLWNPPGPDERWDWHLEINGLLIRESHLIYGQPRRRMRRRMYGWLEGGRVGSGEIIWLTDKLKEAFSWFLCCIRTLCVGNKHLSFSEIWSVLRRFKCLSDRDRQKQIHSHEHEIRVVTCQCRIQDFSDGDVNPLRGANLLFDHFFPKTARQWRTFDWKRSERNT